MESIWDTGRVENPSKGKWTTEDAAESVLQDLVGNPELRETGELHLHAELTIYRAGAQLFSKHCTRILGHKAGANCTAPQSSWDTIALK